MKETVIDVVNAMFADADHQAAWTDGEVSAYAHRVAQAYRREATKWRVAAFRSRQMAASRVTKNGPDVTNFQKRRERERNTPLDPLKEKRDQEKRESPAGILQRVRAEALSGFFEAFFLAYPRHVGRDKAQAAFYKLAKEQKDLSAWSDMLHKALEKQRGMKQWQDADFIPYPATWLKQKRWLDEVPDTNTNANNPTRAVDSLSPELKAINERLNNL